MSNIIPADIETAFNSLNCRTTFKVLTFQGPGKNFAKTVSQDHVVAVDPTVRSFSHTVYYTTATVDQVSGLASAAGIPVGHIEIDVIEIG